MQENATKLFGFVSIPLQFPSMHLQPSPPKSETRKTTAQVLTADIGGGKRDAGEYIQGPLFVLHSEESVWDRWKVKVCNCIYACLEFCHAYYTFLEV